MPVLNYVLERIIVVILFNIFVRRKVFNELTLLIIIYIHTHTHRYELNTLSKLEIEDW